MRNIGVINLVILFVLLITSSCLNRDFINGSSELIFHRDTSLLDSSLFEGYARPIDEIISYPYDPTQFEIWIENTQYNTSTDSNGYYFIMTSPGKYTIRCQSKYNSWDQLIEEVRNIEVAKNQKVRIDFKIGYATE